MSVEYNIYTESHRFVDIRELSRLCTKSSVLAEFEDGPFEIRVLRDADHRFQKFTVLQEGALRDGDTVVGCMQADLTTMDVVLDPPVGQAIDNFFGTCSGSGIAPIYIDEFDFPTDCEGEDASDYIGSDDPMSVRLLESATTMYSVLASGEGWFQLILAHVIAAQLRGLFVDPQSGDTKLYR